MHRGSLIVYQVNAGILKRNLYTHMPLPTRPARADLASSVGWVRRAIRSRNTAMEPNAP